MSHEQLRLCLQTQRSVYTESQEKESWEINSTSKEWAEEDRERTEPHADAVMWGQVMGFILLSSWELFDYSPDTSSLCTSQQIYVCSINSNGFFGKLGRILHLENV